MYKKLILIILILVFLILTTTGFLVYDFFKAYQIYQDGLSLKNDLNKIVDDLETKNFYLASQKLTNWQNKTKAIRSNYSRLLIVNKYPTIKNNFQALDQLFEITDTIIPEAQKSIALADEINKTIIANSSYQELSLDKKEIVLNKIQAELPALQTAVAIAKIDIVKINKDSLMKPLVDLISNSTNQLDQAESWLKIAAPFLSTLPELAGYNQEKTYLLVMQNNDEMRASGGFIGVYGILKIKNGAVTKLEINDVNVLDKPADKFLFVEPPKPIKDYLARLLFFRDANWSPDFPTAAEKLLWFYKAERGPENPTAVIAFDQDMVADLLSVIGPINLGDLVFSPSDFGDLLEYEVEQNFSDRGIEWADRKNVIAKLGTEFLNKIHQLPLSDLAKTIILAQKNFQEKHLLVYDKNPTVEDFYLTENLAGEIKNISGNYFMLVDSNMIGLKTDRVMNKKISCELTKDEAGEIIATVTINYKNNGERDYRTGRYRDYLRLYVPAGSWLLDSQGLVLNDKGKDKDKPGKVDFYNEYGKTAFGGFIYVDLGQEKTVSFKYRLPSNIKAEINFGLYKLFVQKQAGTTGHEFNFKINLDGLEKETKTNLTTDKELKIES